MSELLILLTDVILLTDTIDRQILILCPVPDIVMQEELGNFASNALRAAHNVRFGSLAGMVTAPRDARFTSDSRYTLTRAFTQFVYGNHAATRSISVGSSPGARELFTRLDTGHVCK
jgi:hypothetical protein